MEHHVGSTFVMLAAGEHHVPPLLMTIAAAFTAAWVFGMITQALKLSPIVGYLLGGIAIGKYTPGFAADEVIAAQLAEIGVILLMFGVGLHFHLKDLLAVRKVAIPGAVGQSAVATVLGIGLALAAGMTLKSGMVLGMAMAVASTVVLIRVLTDAKQLETPAGHVAVGWLIVEDIFTVIVLVLIPAMAVAPIGEAATTQTVAATQAAVASSGVLGVLKDLGVAFFKLSVLVGILLVFGPKVVPWVMVKVAKFRSRELFTLTVLVMSMAIAVASALWFGASPALGAFLAGMVVGQTKVSSQAAADALPLKDAFAVLFFASVGMIFDPSFLWNHPFLLAGGLGIVMIGKPLAAMVIVAVLKYPARTGLTVALGLAQIGEFSFILSELGRQSNILNDTGHNLLVACAIISITLNPAVFKLLPKMEGWLKRSPGLWAWMNRGDRPEGENNPAAEAILAKDDGQSVAVILGYGPVGRAVDSALREAGIETLIVDLNMETIEGLTRQGRAAIYGDAMNIEVMSQAVAKAQYLVITLPHATNRNPLIATAKLINPELKVFVRARYVSESEELRQVGTDGVRFEEAEVAVALARLVMEELGKSREEMARKGGQIRRVLDEEGHGGTAAAH